MGKNYLPFANRILARLPADGPLVVPFSSTPVMFGAMDIGVVEEGSRAILGDISVHALTESQEDYLNPGQIGIKYGWLEQGFLTERHIPLDVYMDGGFPLYSTWKFPRPYLLYPKEQLKVRVDNRGNARPSHIGVCGATFSGRKVSTDEPWFLYCGNSNVESEIGHDFMTVFSGWSLRAEEDSAIEIHSVAFANSDAGRALIDNRYQVIGPGSRDWLKTDSQIVGAIANEELKREAFWVNPWSSLIELGEKDGWFMHQGQTFIIDLQNWTRLEDMEVIITLRGSLEVDDDR